MSRHGWIGVLLICSLKVSTSFAAVTIAGLDATRAAAPVGQTNVIYYFSHIDGTLDTSVTPNYRGETVGGTCYAKYNPNCKEPGTIFHINATASATNSGNGKIYLIAGNGTPTNGRDITTSLGLVETKDYPTGTGNVQFASSFGTICQAAGVNNTDSQVANLGGNCAKTAGRYPIVINLTIVLDTGGNGKFDTTDDYASITLKINSEIPAESSSTGTVAGFYSFIAFPGDEKIHIRSPVSEATFPSIPSGGVGIQAVRFFFTPGPDTFDANTFQQLDFSTSDLRDINLLNSSGDLSSYFINNLSNGLRYYIRTALVDESGNIGYVLPAGSNDSIVTHTAKPDEVIGLLSKNSCFVATAAFGSPYAGPVKILREFRDHILLKAKAGQAFVGWYYQHAPYWAEKIQKHDLIRTGVRAALYPLVGFSWVALKMGAANASMLFATVLLLPFLFFRLWQSRHIYRKIQ